MTDKTQRTIANVTFQAQKPTTLAITQLYNWVIWQFPQQKMGGFCSAVHPPISTPYWYPAIVRRDGQQIQVFAHLEEQFSSPEAAMSYLHNNK